MTTEKSKSDDDRRRKRVREWEEQDEQNTELAMKQCEEASQLDPHGRFIYFMNADLRETKCVLNGMKQEGWKHIKGARISENLPSVHVRHVMRTTQGFESVPESQFMQTIKVRRSVLKEMGTPLIQDHIVARNAGDGINLQSVNNPHFHLFIPNAHMD